MWTRKNSRGNSCLTKPSRRGTKLGDMYRELDSFGMNVTYGVRRCTIRFAIAEHDAKMKKETSVEKARTVPERPNMKLINKPGRTGCVPPII